VSKSNLKSHYLFILKISVIPLMFYPRFQHIKLGVLPLEVGNFSPEMPSFYVDLPTVIMPISDECKKLFFTKGEVYLVRISIVVFLQLRLCPDCSSLNMSNAVV